MMHSRTRQEVAYEGTSKGLSEKAHRNTSSIVAKLDRINYRCMACYAEINSTYNANLHPILTLLTCRKCAVSYGNGNFSTFDDGVDEEGDDNLCRLCADGGDLYGCMNENEYLGRCHNSFCQGCLKRNFPADLDKLRKLETNPSGTNFKFICYVCDQSKIQKLQQYSIKALKFLNLKDRPEDSFTTLPKYITEQDIEIRLKQIDSLRKLLVSEFHDKYKQIMNIYASLIDDQEARRIIARNAMQGLELSIEEFYMIVKRFDNLCKDLE